MGWLVSCPACGYNHLFSEFWEFNGDIESPTFTPSMLVRSYICVPLVTAENLDEWKRAPWEQTKVETICHSFVTDGMIHYLSDCTHSFAGKTIPLEKSDGKS